MRKLTLEEFNQKIKEIHPLENLKAINYNGDKKYSEVICLNCNQVYKKLSGQYTSKKVKSICKNCFPTQTNILKTDYVPPKNYKLMSPYKGMHNKVSAKHEVCGFIWNTTPANFKQGKGCPKCNRKTSKGEQKISEWLINHKIEFLPQYKITIEGHNLLIDFYIPSIDLYIEYNGEQHYNEVAFFGGKKKFEQQIKLDNLKKEYLKNKLLIISYLDFNNIETILESSTTISKESRL